MTETTLKPLAGRTILISPDDSHNELKRSLEHYGARVITWPPFETHEPHDFAALDEAIDDLFGYDWIIFRSAHAVESFLNRFHQRGHEISELDELRVLAFGNATSNRLELSHVHVDLVAAEDIRKDKVAEIENYVGGSASLQAINFLNLRAAHSCERLSEELESRGARVDRLVTYRTVSDDSVLVQLKTLLAGGGIDCIILQSAKDCETVAELFDVSDLRPVIDGPFVASMNLQISDEAVKFGLKPEIVIPDSAITTLVKGIVNHFSPPTGNR